MTPTRLALAVGAVAGAFGLSLVAAGIAGAQTTPSTTPTPSTIAPSTGHPHGDCPLRGGSGTSAAPTSGV